VSMYMENAPAVHIQGFVDNCLQLENNNDIIVITYFTLNRMNSNPLSEFLF